MVRSIIARALRFGLRGWGIQQHSDLVQRYVCTLCTEAKLKADQVNENTGLSGQPPLLEPVTPRMVASLETKGQQSQVVTVEQTKGSTAT
jgi:hypothetical protein